MYQKWLAILTKCVLFQEIPTAQLEEMLNCLRPRLVKYAQKNNVVAIEGESCEAIGVVLEGEVAVTKENAEGTRVIMTKLGEGGLFGEIIAFSAQRVWPATITTIKPSEIMFVPVEKIIGNCPRQCDCHRQLIKNMLRIVSQRALLLNKKVNYLSIKSLRGKISTFLWEHYKKNKQNTFIIPLPRQECADFLNVSRPALSREMARMRDEGIIEFYQQTVKIIDPDSLKKEVR